MSRHISVYVLIVFIAFLGPSAAPASPPSNPSSTAVPTSPPSNPSSTAVPTSPPSNPSSTAVPTSPPSNPSSTAVPTSPPSNPSSTAVPTSPPSNPSSTAVPTSPPSNPSSTAVPTSPPSNPSSTIVPPSPPSNPSSTIVPPSPPSNPSSTIVPPSPILIPDTFYYNCTDNGGIEIMNNGSSLSNVIINYLNQSSGSCANPKTLSDGSVMLGNCTKNTTIDIVLETTNGTAILGGLHSKTFQIKCEDVNIEPYFLNVTANENVGGHETPQVITMAPKSTPSPISSLNMIIKNNISGVVTEASIGQELTIVITTPAKASIKPTECKATGNDKDVILWQEKGCKHDDELFGEKWINSSDSITNTMYGFRFVGSSKSITITCTVRVCPEGYKGYECDLACKPTKRKRVNRLSDDVKMEMATTSLAIKDPLLTSGGGRLGFEWNNIIGLAVAVLVFINMKE